MKERRASQKLSSKSIMDPNQNVKCKIVVVGDSQCGKTALLHVFAKDCFPEVSAAGRPGLGRGRGPPAGIPPSGVGLLLALPPSPHFLFLSSLSYYFPPGETAGKGKVSWNVSGTRLHIPLLASETCSVLGAEPGWGGLDPHVLGSRAVRVMRLGFQKGAACLGGGIFSFFFFKSGSEEAIFRGCYAGVVLCR